MKPVLDIFSKKEIKEKKKSKNKIKIIADYREKNSLVVSEIINLGCEIEMKNLPVADFLVKDIAIERKTISDFISSMINKRLLKQLEEIQQYKNRLLIIEGIDEQELYFDKIENVRFPSEAIEEIAQPWREGKCVRENRRLSSNAIRGFLLSILLKYKVPILLTKNYEDTAKFLLILAKKQKKEISIKAKKKTLNKKERLQFILEGFPGIGPKNAKKLLEKFKTIKGIINASEEELKELIGKKAEIIKSLIDEPYS